MTFQQMTQAIRNYSFPEKAAYVSIWWDNFSESQKLMSLLYELGYRVNYYREPGVTEIRFAYTNRVKKAPIPRIGRGL